MLLEEDKKWLQGDSGFEREAAGPQAYYCMTTCSCSRGVPNIVVVESSLDSSYWNDRSELGVTASLTATK
eukprot:scaffold312_cov409-Pavlova_lutheri.AAC.7